MHRAGLRVVILPVLLGSFIKLIMPSMEADPCWYDLFGRLFFLVARLRSQDHTKHHKKLQNIGLLRKCSYGKQFIFLVSQSAIEWTCIVVCYNTGMCWLNGLPLIRHHAIVGVLQCFLLWFRCLTSLYQFSEQIQTACCKRFLSSM